MERCRPERRFARPMNVRERADEARRLTAEVMCGLSAETRALCSGAGVYWGRTRAKMEILDYIVEAQESRLSLHEGLPIGSSHGD